MEWARWHLKPGRADCASCRKLYARNDEEAPCPLCPMPKEDLLPAGACALALWSLLDEHDRQYWSADGTPLPLGTACVREAAQDYGLGLEMQELVLELDREICRMRREEMKKKKGKQAKAG